MMKTALVTGITGQDGGYLAEFLLQKGYTVYGMRRRLSGKMPERLEKLVEMYPDRFFLRYGDLTDSAVLCKLIRDIWPDEIYNLGAQSHVGVSFENPIYTADVDALGTLRLLEAIRQAGLTAATKFYQASTSELFGKVYEVPQTEVTPFHPRSPYGVSKLFAYWAVVNAREAFGMFACNGILFNHESPYRGEDFVTRKITKGVAQILRGKQDCIYLGNLDAERDWGFAGDYVKAMWMMLQRDIPGDFVIATGEKHTVREFVEAAFEVAGVRILWVGTGVEETGYDSVSGEAYVKISPEFYRPSEVDQLLGSPRKAKLLLGWQPEVSFKDLVSSMVQHDLEVANA
jgi:GDPmannose 4,6-dehydratase